MHNLHPAEQITEDKKETIKLHIKSMSKRYGIDEEIVANIFRVGYELGWNNALQTDGASVFLRLLAE